LCCTDPQRRETSSARGASYSSGCQCVARASQGGPGQKRGSDRGPRST
jgi:hypothetical protein